MAGRFELYRTESGRRPRKTEFVTVGVNQVEGAEALTHSALRGKVAGSYPERMVVERVDIGNLEDYPPNHEQRRSSD